jgi:hypothetical protein
MKIDPKYTFPAGMAMTLFCYHTLLMKWNADQTLPFWLALGGFIVMLSLTIATFYKKTRF